MDFSIVLLLNNNDLSLWFIKSKHLMLLHQIYSVCGYVGIGLIPDQTQGQRGLHQQILRITMKKGALHLCLSKVHKSQLRYADLNYIKILNFFHTRDQDYAPLTPSVIREKVYFVISGCKVLLFGDKLWRTKIKG